MNNNDIEYPFMLSYTKPNGEKVSVEVHDDGQAEDEYHDMWWACGQDVRFSVDAVEAHNA
jgi:hypothetical protein